MNQALRIAFLAPIKRPITPQTTISRNRIIVDLIAGLTRAGHTVTVLGTGDSDLPGVTINRVIPKALINLPPAENPFYQHTAFLTLMIRRVLSMQDEFDLVHSHMYPEFLPLLAYREFRIPLVTTVHAQMTDELKAALSEFPAARLVAISDAARRASGLPMRVVHNGVDTDFFVPQEGKKEYLLFVGRMSKARGEDGQFLDPKGVQDAIRIAEKSGETLKIVGNVEDPVFFDTLIKPHLSSTITFVGEVSSEQKLTRQEMRDLFAGAKALLNPIRWEEPFGLVMVESLSCGTPVIAYNRGSAGEIIEDGLTGFVLDSSRGVDGFLHVLGKISGIDRAYCRHEAVSRFSAGRMAEGYEAIYREAMEKKRR